MPSKRFGAAVLALSLPLVLAVAAPATAAPAPTVTVKGHITSPTGKPVAGVQVSVYSDGSDGHHVVRRARTSRTGRYEISIVKTQRAYQLKVLDYGDADADHGDGEWAPIRRTFDFEGRSARVNQVLHHGARLSGRILDRAGKRVGAGIRVDVSVAGSTQPGASTLTRSDGTYRITNAPAGASVVAFTSPRIGESRRWYTRSSILGTADGTKATRIRLAFGRSTSGIDFRFPYLGSISGTVTVDGQEPGEEGSSVVAVLLDSTGAEQYDVLANPEFALRDLLPGTYFVEFRAVSSEPGAIVTEYYRDSSTLSGAVPLVIGAKGTAITGLRPALASK